MSTSPKPPSDGFNPEPLSSPDDAFSGVSLTRYANTAQGLLARRDLQALRRFILDAADAKEQSHRQHELLEFSTQDLVLWPDTAQSGNTTDAEQPMFMGLYAWPLVVCMQDTLCISNLFRFDDSGSRPLKAAMAEAWAKTLGVPCDRVVIDAAITPQLVAGASPLALQSFTKAAYKRWYAQAKSIAGQKLNDHTPTQGMGPTMDVWNQLAPFASSSKGIVGPSQPMAFLMMAMVLWDVNAPQPVATDFGRSWSRRMETLLQASFMHSQARPGAAQTDNRRIVIHSELRAGQPQSAPQATTQAQWMQLAWMAERACKSGSRYQLEVENHGSAVHWHAKVVDEEQEVSAEIDYEYDGFWRPAEHIQQIVQRVDLAQGRVLER